MGAKPEAVVDIILCGQLEKAIVVKLVEALAQACREQECSLVGGETSVQPGVLSPGTYMLNACVLGVVDKGKIIDGSRIRIGDRVLAIASNGLHTNGYSLVRRLLEQKPELVDARVGNEEFLDAILRPHMWYYKALRGLFGLAQLHGLAHITGGGIEGNLNRILPRGMSALVHLDRIQVLPVFDIIRRVGGIADAEMLRTFNMGVGMTAVVDSLAVEELMTHVKGQGLVCYDIGEIVSGDQSVRFQGQLPACR